MLSMCRSSISIAWRIRGMTVLCLALPARSTYTQAFVRQLPLHRALPILFWAALSRLLRWKPPVLPLRRAILHEARREGLPMMYRVILRAFGPEIGCALRVSHPGCRQGCGRSGIASIRNMRNQGYVARRVQSPPGDLVGRRGAGAPRHVLQAGQGPDGPAGHAAAGLLRRERGRDHRRLHQVFRLLRATTHRGCLTGSR